MRTTSSKESCCVFFLLRRSAVFYSLLAGCATRSRGKDTGEEGRAYTAVLAPRAQISLRRGVRLAQGAVGNNAVGHVGQRMMCRRLVTGDRWFWFVVGPNCSRARWTTRRKESAGVRGWTESGAEHRRAGPQKAAGVDRVLPRTLLWHAANHGCGDGGTCVSSRASPERAPIT